MSLIIFSDTEHLILSLFIEDNVIYDFVKWMRSHPGSLYHKSMIYRIHARNKYHAVYDVPETKCYIRVKTILKVDQNSLIDAFDYTTKQRFHGSLDKFWELVR